MPTIITWNNFHSLLSVAVPISVAAPVPVTILIPAAIPLPTQFASKPNNRINQP